MDYFTILNLDREPFSNAPDPDFFFQSRQHVGCLQKLELALRLKRGLNIVIGAVGAGKTTLCRTLLNKFASDPSIESHLILDPSFNSPLAFLETISTLIVGKTISDKDAHGLKEQIKHHLYQKGVDEKKNVILVIDEGQKLPAFCLEILRELLNYETNDYKLLQIVLFAQEEFQDVLDRRANLADRVNLIHFLGPMSLADTRQMIRFRIKHASSSPRPPKLFTEPALHAIYRATGGYPRKIINLCHQCMLALIVQNRSRVNWRLVRSCRNRSLAHRWQHRPNHRTLAFSALMVFAVIGLLFFGHTGWFPSIPGWVSGTPTISNMQAATHSSEASPLPVAAIPTSDIPGGPDRVHETPMADNPLQKQAIVKPVQPSMLGVLTVKRNDTLGLMVKTIYGDFRDRTLKAVLDANPHISHADAIRVGDNIAFPAIPVALVQRAYPLWWLKAGEAESLDAAFRRSIKVSDNVDAPLMRIITEWDHQAGLKYGIYVAGYFFNPSAAESMMKKLPADFSGSAEIISGWTDQTVLFSDPFLGRGY